MPDRVALVTGASGGLGAAIACVLDRRGFRLALLYHSNAERARQVQREMRNLSLAVQADVASWESVREMEATVEAELGPVAVVVNCSGVRRDGLMATQSPDEWADVVSTNLLGTFHVCRAVLPRMLASRWGRVVNVVSPAGVVGSAGQTAYSASKAGVIGMTRSLALECARRGVTVNALSPGYMETDMTRDLPSQAKQKLLDAIPLRRVTTPGEVAETVALIVDTPYMTGHVLAVDGGMSV
jgi:3-oxoacyl-[acyl-carrier protein] reductase